MRLDRLRKLYRHLMRGELGHKEFDFSGYNNVRAGRCGTAGCALGEMPILDHENWKFKVRPGRQYSQPTLRIDPPAEPFWPLDPIRSAEIYFGISADQAAHLFIPGGQRPRSFSGKHLEGEATRYQVAANLKAFIDKYAKKAKERRLRNESKRRRTSTQAR